MRFWRRKKAPQPRTATSLLAELHSKSAATMDRHTVETLVHGHLVIAASCLGGAARSRSVDSAGSYVNEARGAMELAAALLAMADRFGYLDEAPETSADQTRTSDAPE